MQTLILILRALFDIKMFVFKYTYNFSTPFKKKKLHTLMPSVVYSIYKLNNELRQYYNTVSSNL